MACLSSYLGNETTHLQHHFVGALQSVEYCCARPYIIGTSLRWLGDLTEMVCCTGGNVDNRRMGIGSSMYYPVAVEGALVSMGDAHSAQGDSEFDGQSAAAAAAALYMSSHAADCICCLAICCLHT